MEEPRGTIEITQNVYWIGANDRETDKFEGLWELPHGISYNSYFIDDKKTVIIDSVKSHYTGDFLERLDTLLAGRQLDYVIVNHMEPDHSGSLVLLRRLFPAVKFVGNAKTAEMIDAFYGITDGIIVIREGDILDIGSRKLTFAMIPMVHWPESMVTFEMTERILFSNDAFGGFGALEAGIFDDSCPECAIDEMMRYYVNIVGRFANQAGKAVAKVRSLQPTMICPAHGSIWRNDPEQVINLYGKWSAQETEEGVVVVYGSMYGNTKIAADMIALSLSENGTPNVKIYDISRANLSNITTDIWRYRGLVLAACTYNMELYPPMRNLLSILENKNMRGRFIGLCGSYSWAGAALGEMKAFVERSRGAWQLIEPTVEFKSHPTNSDLENCYALGSEMACALKRDGDA